MQEALGEDAENFDSSSPLQDEHAGGTNQNDEDGVNVIKCVPGGDNARRPDSTYNFSC